MENTLSVSLMATCMLEYKQLRYQLATRTKCTRALKGNGAHQATMLRVMAEHMKVAMTR
jgi:hypothetical protein